jgi:hypothetical protein
MRSSIENWSCHPGARIVLVFLGSFGRVVDYVLHRTDEQCLILCTLKAH